MFYEINLVRQGINRKENSSDSEEDTNDNFGLRKKKGKREGLENVTEEGFEDKHRKLFKGSEDRNGEGSEDKNEKGSEDGNEEDNRYNFKIVFIFW